MRIHASQVCVIGNFILYICCIFLSVAALNMETLLNRELPPVVKTAPRLSCPTFPIPGAVEPPSKESEIPMPREEHPHLPLQPPESKTEVDKENVEEVSKKPVLYYTPDDEELVHQEHAKEVDEVDHANCAPLFNDPVYPSSSYSSLTSTIGKSNKFFNRT